jgi:hypothetical protein
MPCPCRFSTASVAMAYGSSRMLTGLRVILGELVVNPGRVARRYHGALGLYKAFSNTVTSSRRQRLRRLTTMLPSPTNELRVTEDEGFKVLAPGRFASADPLIARCRGVVGQAGQRPSKKAQLDSLVGVDQVQHFPEFLDFCLDPTLLGIAADYLHELPILASVEFWHSRATADQFQNSQLYHSDLDDIRQFKIFLFVSDVDEAAGPLTVVPAGRSEQLRRALRYRPRSGHVRIEDEQIRPLLEPGDEHSLTGPAGTVVFIDTSRVLHFGSRVATRDRYVVMVQYLALTNFMYNPFYSFKAWPYAHLARPGMSAAQRAVLGEAVVPVVGRGRRAGTPVDAR